MTAARPFDLPLRWVRAAALTLFAAPALAQGPLPVIPGSTPHYFALLPGQVAEYAFQVRAPIGLSGDAMVGGYLEVPDSVFAEYEFTALNPAQCAVPILQAQSFYTSLRFPVPALALFETRTCRYQVQRATGSTSDLGFNACLQFGSNPSNFCNGRARIGSLPDLELSVEPVATEADGSALLRLRLINRSPLEVSSRIASTGCHEFGGGLFAPTAFDLIGSLPGGCASAFGVACLNFTGQQFDSRAFALGPAPAGGSSTCLVRARAMGSVGSIQVSMSLFGDRVTLPGGALAFDPVRGGELGVVGLGLGPSGAAPVPLGGAVTTTLLLLFLASGLAILRANRNGA